MVLHLENESFDEVIKCGVVLVDFYASWCGPCQRLAPIVESVAQDSGVKALKVDVDIHNELARRFGVMSIPTVMLFKDGVMVKKAVGYMDEEALKKFINL